MSLRTMLLVSCAALATMSSARAQGTETAPSLVVDADRPVDPPRAAGSGEPTTNAPAALELSRIPTAPATPTAAGASAMAGTPATSLDAAPPLPIDLSALWYFAAQKDFGRVAAETKRIRKNHPDWTPPPDLFSAAEGGGPEEQPLWELYAKQDYDGMRASIAAMKRERPDWTPSANLQGKLALAEARVALMKASEAQDWATVVTLATANRMLLTCRDLESLWRTAEALGRSGDEKRAFETYRYTLTTCTAPHDRLATVQKAGTVLQSSDNYDKLLALGRRQGNGAGEFDGLRLDRFRRSIGEAAADRSLPAPPQAALDAVAASAKEPAGQADAQLLGWYSYSRKDYPAAKAWFEQALAAGPDAKAAEGLTMSLRGANDIAAARKAAVQYAPLGADNRRLLVEIITAAIADPSSGPVTSEEAAALGSAVDEFKSQDGAQALALLAEQQKDKAAAKTWSDKQFGWKGEEIEAAKSAEGAEALGWQFYTAGDLAGAETWFQKSAEWSPNEAAALGLVLTAHRLHHDKDYVARVAQYRAMFPRIAELEKSMRAHGPQSGRKRMASNRHGRAGASGIGGWDKSARDIITVFRAGNYKQAIVLLDQRRAKRSEPRGLTLVRGWALYHAGDWGGAKQIFSTIDNGRYSDERQEGLNVIERSYTPPRFR